VGTGVLYLESCVLALEDSIVLVHQRRNPVCLCEFRVTLQRTSFSHRHREWEKTWWWVRTQLDIRGCRETGTLGNFGRGPLIKRDVTGVLASLPGNSFHCYEAAGR